MKLKKIIFLCIVLIINGFAFSQTPVVPLQFPEFKLAKLEGAGGSFSTQNAGFNTLFTNPAIFSQLNKKWNIMTLNFFSDTFTDSQTHHSKMDVLGPISFGLTGKNFAFGIFNTTRANLVVDLKQKKYDLILGEQLFLTGGFGAEIINNEKNAVSVGVQMKGFFQGFVYQKDAILKTQNYSLIQLAKESLSENSNIMLTYGFGFDIGGLYNYNNFFKLGFVVRDLYTATFSSMYKNFDDFKKSKVDGKTHYRSVIPTLDLGLSISPKLPEKYSAFTGFTFWLEYKDILSPLKNKRPFYYNIASGLEFEFNSAYYLRLGFSEIMPCFGVGLDAQYLSLDISFKPWKKIGKDLKKLDPIFAVDFTIKL